ncbi:MAG: hypothetical protein HY648_13115 [Acidobacteria bacterium]|nr:hypothetical protein [Acidobacteriota bacterium]
MTDNEKIVGHQTCTFCKGSGKRNGWKCDVCGGSGKMPIYEKKEAEDGKEPALDRDSAT